MEPKLIEIAHKLEDYELIENNDYILAYLGNYGNASDLDRIERFYGLESSSYSKTT